MNNQYDRNNAFSYFLSDFKDNFSIISDIFFGLTETTNVCLNCKNIFNSKGKHNPICYYYQKAELFTGDNKNYCNICKQLNESLYTPTIFSSPNVLVLILNRGK